MPLKLRWIPKASKRVFQRRTPNHILINKLEKLNLTFPMNKEFVEKIKSRQPPERPTGFDYPVGGYKDLPFYVPRTKSGSLPVYIDYRKGRTQTLTIVRKIAGDVMAVKNELEKVTGSDVELKQGRVECHGNHVRLVRLWLRALGF